MGRRVRAKRDWGTVPAGTQGIVISARHITWLRGWTVAIAWQAPTGERVGRFTASDYRCWVEEL